MCSRDARDARDARDVREKVLNRIGNDIPDVLLIDGPSGAGKSSLADVLHTAWPGSQLVRLDDIYPGWTGLDYASEYIVDRVLLPRSRGEQGWWQRYDWARGEPSDWHEVDQNRALIIEGCGALSRKSAPHADSRIWLSADFELRKRRALARDAGGFEPFWELWQQQFEAFVDRERPRELADVILNVTE